MWYNHGGSNGWNKNLVVHLTRHGKRENIGASRVSQHNKNKMLWIMGQVFVVANQHNRWSVDRWIAEASDGSLDRQPSLAGNCASIKRHRFRPCAPIRGSKRNACKKRHSFVPVTTMICYCAIQRCEGLTNFGFQLKVTNKCRWFRHRIWLRFSRAVAQLMLPTWNN